MVQHVHRGPLRASSGVSAALLAGSALTVAALLRFRPHLSGSPNAWRGDDVALAAAWVLAVVLAAWLTLTTVACLAAAAGGRHAFAARVAAWAPPVARRALQLALAGSALVPTAAYATAAPLTLHVGPGGRLTTVSGAAAASRAAGDDTPVVRAPSSTTSTTSSSPAPPVITSTTTWPRSAGHNPTPVHSPIRIAPPAEHVAAPRVRTSAARTYVVRAGDNLWRIARAEMARATGAALPDDQQVAEYWHRLVAANQATLRSGDPSLIFPGELVTLPRIDH